MLKKLKALRQEHGITQKQLAEAIGVSQQSINKYENQNIEPDIRTLIRIADYFSVSTDHLIGHTETHESSAAVLSEEERLLLQNWRSLTACQRTAVKYVIKSYKG